ncbi:MAG: glycosyltransferase family 2 protein [Acidobacteriota bacterium]|nr:glycosyltransferase family 2 protein [Acidobacteriota bacterium]MDQ3417934.1 glycosyltransferase family 2 protein [Acidobacteriota bacterium]
MSIVLPVYNEAGSVAHVVSEWMATVDRLGILYEFLVLDDGSTDDTQAALGSLAARHPHLRVLRHANIGHGPTILRGFTESRGDWVFQIDSDGEIGPAGFDDMWRHREGFDLLLGDRISRSAPLVRQVITAVSRASVRLLFGRGIHDVNVPYRLMRGPLLRELAAALPPNLFAPNVILSGLAIRRQLRIYQTPVQHVGRQHGQSSLGRFSVLRPAARSLWQTGLIAWRDRAGSRRRG